MKQPKYKCSNKEWRKSDFKPEKLFGKTVFVHREGAFKKLTIPEWQFQQLK